MKQEAIIIQQIDHQDLRELMELARETFMETFAGQNNPADMLAYLDSAFSEERLSAELMNPESFFFIARIDGQPAGYLKLNIAGAQTELQNQDSLEIERIYVLRAYQGKSIGKALYQKALDWAKAQGLAYIWLGVWEENSKAIRFYQRNGFIPFSQHTFMLGNDKQVDIMMKKTL